jgi:quinolinate synthase
VPDLTVWYGPDTYMGANLESMLTALAAMPDERIQALHPAHNRATVAALLPRFRYFRQGNCVVHHMFGDKVVERVRAGYGGALHTAHLEVPGEMFALAMEAAHDGRGVVGSTSDILNFIRARAAAAVPWETLQVSLCLSSVCDVMCLCFCSGGWPCM